MGEYLRFVAKFSFEGPSCLSIMLQWGQNGRPSKELSLLREVLAGPSSYSRVIVLNLCVRALFPYVGSFL